VHVLQVVQDGGQISDELPVLVLQVVQLAGHVWSEAQQLRLVGALLLQVEMLLEVVLEIAQFPEQVQLPVGEAVGGNGSGDEARELVHAPVKHLVVVLHH